MAEAAATIGLASSITSLINLNTEIESHLNDFAANSCSIPESFRLLVGRLSLLTPTLQLLQDRASNAYAHDIIVARLNTLVGNILEQASFVAQYLHRNVLASTGWQLDGILDGTQSLMVDDDTQCRLDQIHHWIDVLLSYRTTIAVEIGDCSRQELSHLNNESCHLQPPVPNLSSQRPTRLMNDSVSVSRSQLKRRSHILRLLKTCDYEGAKFRVSRRVPETCEWFTRHVKHQRWRQQTSTSILWYTADPGCGKTVLARYLIDEAYPPDSIVLSFIFTRQDRRSSKASTALCAMLHQLYLTQPLLLEYAEKVYQEAGRGFVSEPTTLWRLLLQSIINGYEGEVICVLDALDECETAELKILLNLILEEFQTPHEGFGTIKLCVTSRPYHRIMRNVSNIASRVSVFHISDETERAFISQDVRTFVQSRIRQLELSSQERMELEEKILRKQGQDQTFLWAFLVTEQLEDAPLSTCKKLVALIDQLPSTVLEMYEAILEGCADVRRARWILAMIVAAREPLTLDQMDVILAIEHHGNILEHLDLEGPVRLTQNIKHICGLFIKVSNNKLYLIHQTARDSLLDTNSTATFDELNDQGGLLWHNSIMIDQTHYQLASACIKVLRLRDTICRSPLFEPGSTNGSNLMKKILGQKLVQINSFVIYAIANWTIHVLDSLQYLQHRSHNRSIEQMIGLGLDLQMLDADGKSLLHRALDIRVPKLDVELIRCIVHYGGLVSRADHDNMTCMHYAVLHCNQNVVQTLQQAGLDIDTQVKRKPRSIGLVASSSTDSRDLNALNRNTHGLTPLHIASLFGKKDIVPFIISQCADVNARDSRGQTPLHLVMCGRLRGPRLFDFWERWSLMPEHISGIYSKVPDERILIVEMLCGHLKIDVNVKNKYGQTPLHTILYPKVNTWRVVKLLVDRGARTATTDNNGMTPIHVAARAGDVDSLSVLIRNPGDLITRDGKGRNALCHAARSRNIDAVLFVLQASISLGLYQPVDWKNDLRNALPKRISLEGSWIQHHLIRQAISSPEHARMKTELAFHMTSILAHTECDIIPLLLTHGSAVNMTGLEGDISKCDLATTGKQVELESAQLPRKTNMCVPNCDQMGDTLAPHAAIHKSIGTKLHQHWWDCHQPETKETATVSERANNCVTFGDQNFARHGYTFAWADD